MDADAGDVLDSAGGILGATILGMTGLYAMKMMGDMANNMNRNSDNMNKSSNLKAQNTLNFGGPRPRKEQKSYNPPKPTQEPRHNYFSPYQNDFFSPEIKKRESQKPWYEW